MAVNMTIPATFEDALSTPEQIEWLYKNKEALLQAGANIEITRSGDRTIITAVGEGFSPTVSVEEIPGGHEVTITDGTGPHVFDVMDGLDGDDGVSPTVTITSITGGHRVVITDEDHPLGQTFDIMDGTDGVDGDSVTVKSTTPVEGGVNLVLTDKNGDHTIFLANGPQGLTGPQGPQGPTGATGATGETGATPIITMTASADGTYSASPTVTVTKTGTDLNPAFSLAFSGLRGQTGATGEQGPAGQDGSDGQDGTDGVSPEVTITSITGGHEVTITDADHPLGQSFDVMDGTDGQDGTNGTDGTDGVSPEVTITAITGGHEVTITDADHPSGQTFEVMDGTDGQDGQDGAPGQDGVTPVITATATADATHSANPSVTVTKSGTDAAPTFAFAFSGLQGEQGAAGQNGQDGADGQGVPTGGTTGQVLAKASGTDYDTEWVTPSGGSDVSCGVIDATNISSITFSDASGSAITIDAGQVNKPAILVTKKNDGTYDRFEIEVAQEVYCGYATADSSMTVKTLEFVFGNGTNALTVSIDGETVTLPEESYGSLIHRVMGKSDGFKCKRDGMMSGTAYFTGNYSVWYEGKQIHLKYTFDEAVTVTRLESIEFKSDREIQISGGSVLPAIASGDAGKVLTVNSGATAAEWATPAAGEIYYGKLYRGNYECNLNKDGLAFYNRSNQTIAVTGIYGTYTYCSFAFKKEKTYNKNGIASDTAVVFEMIRDNSAGINIPSVEATFTNAYSSQQGIQIAMGQNGTGNAMFRVNPNQLEEVPSGGSIGPMRRCKCVTGSTTTYGWYWIYCIDKTKPSLRLEFDSNISVAAGAKATFYFY